MSNAGPIARGVLSAALKWAPIQAALSTWGTKDNQSWRVTFTVRYVKAGEVPAERYEWHVDRVSPGFDSYEKTDYSHNVGNDVAVCTWHDFAPVDSSSTASTGTEIILSPMQLALGGDEPGSAQSLIASPKQFASAVESFLANHGANVELLAAPRSHLVGLSSATVHRPPKIHSDGWRLFFRLGKTLEPYSRYSDHRTTHLLSCVPETGEVRCRPSGTPDEVEYRARRSIPLVDRAGS
jgi:hypothetical protein